MSAVFDSNRDLKASEIRYRRLFEATQDGILILDAETGMIEDVNPYLIKMLGYSRDEFLKKKLWEVGSFRDVEASKEAFEILQDREYIRYENLPLKTKAGRLIQVEFVSNVYVAGHEKVIQCNIRDITEHKHIVAVLQANERKYYDLLALSPDGIFIIDLTGRILTVNKAMCQELGYSEEEFLAMTIWDIIPAQYLNEYKNRLTKILAGEVFEGGLEYEVRGRDGQDHFVEIFSTPHYDEKDIVGFQGIARDITQRKQAEAHVRNSHEFLQSVQNALSAHIAILDPEGNIVQVNSAWREFGRKNGLKHPNYCIGMNYLKVCDSATGENAEGASLFAKAIREVLSGGQDEVSVEYACHAPQEKRWFVAHVTSFMNAQQRWIVVAHENISGRKLAEEKTQRQVDHLLALSSIDRMISVNFDLKLTLSEILTHVTAELKVDAADILVMDPSLQILEFGAEHGFRTNIVHDAQVRLGEGYAGRVAMERKLVQVKMLDEAGETLFLNDILKDEEFSIYLGVPLITKGQLRGVLEVYHRSLLQPDNEWFEFLNTLAGQASIAIENATLFDGLQRSTSELVLAYDATIEGWSRALDLRDKETEGHSLRVTEMTVELARAFDLSDMELTQVRWGSLLHDIGKMGVPDAILLKPGALTEDEWIAMKKHPIFAYEMLAPIRYLRLALDIPYCHHEKWDGTGYPRGLSGEQIPLSARIFAIVDVWDALTSDRPYRAAWTDNKAHEYILSVSGTHFEPQIVEKFMQVFDKAGNDKV